MRTTLNLDDALMEEAGEYAGVKGRPPCCMRARGPSSSVRRRRIDGLMLWTRDRPLAKAAAELGLRPA